MIKLTDEQLSTLQGLEVAGVLTASAVVAEAKKPDSPLHTLFDWNVEESAERYWRMRARSIIARVRLRIQTSTMSITAPAYVRDPEALPKEQGYRRVEAVRADEELARVTLRAELQRVSAMLSRAQRMAVALNLESQLQELLAEVSSLRLILGDTTTEIDLDTQH